MEPRRRCPAFWSKVFPTAYDTRFTPPKIAEFDGTAPDCHGRPGPRPGLLHRRHPPSTWTRPTWPTPAYDEIGDFALTTALSLPYSLAVRDQAGPVDRRRRGHPVGGLPHRLVRGPVVQQRLRRRPPRRHRGPGDIDEAVQFLLEYGVRPEVFPNTSASGFELVGAFRTGFLQDDDACDLGR